MQKWVGKKNKIMTKLAQMTIRSTEQSIAYSPCYRVVLMHGNGLVYVAVVDCEAHTIKIQINYERITKLR